MSNKPENSSVPIGINLISSAFYDGIFAPLVLLAAKKGYKWAQETYVLCITLIDTLL